MNTLIKNANQFAAAVVFIFVIVLAIVLSGCGGSSGADTKTPETQTDANKVSENKPEEKAETPKSLEFWPEPLLSRSATPPVAVDFVLEPGAKSFFILGRDGDLHRIHTSFESLAIKEKTKRKKAKKYRGAKIERVKVTNTYAKGDMGAMAIALDPSYKENGFLYVWYCDKGDKNTILDRYKWAPTQAEFDKSRTEIIRVSRYNAPAPYHAGGICQFMPDGTMLLCPGDAEQPKLSQDPNILCGKLLRIRPKYGPEGGYEVPADNVKAEGFEHKPEIVATGLRAVFRGYLHQGKQLIFGDVGAAREEVNVWNGKNENYGWGMFDFADGPNMPEGVTRPLVWWDKKSDWTEDDPYYEGETRLSAGVGIVYQPQTGEQDRYKGLIDNHLIFFEIMRGWVRSGLWNAETATLGEHGHIGHLATIAQMKQGSDGYIYALTWGGNPTLFRLRPQWDTKAH